MPGTVGIYASAQSVYIPLPFVFDVSAAYSLQDSNGQPVPAVTGNVLQWTTVDGKTKFDSIQGSGRTQTWDLHNGIPSLYMGNYSYGCSLWFQRTLNTSTPRTLMTQCFIIVFSGTDDPPNTQTPQFLTVQCRTPDPWYAFGLGTSSSNQDVILVVSESKVSKESTVNIGPFPSPSVTRAVAVCWRPDPLTGNSIVKTVTSATGGGPATVVNSQSSDIAFTNAVSSVYESMEIHNFNYIGRPWYLISLHVLQPPVSDTDFLVQFNAIASQKGAT